MVWDGVERRRHKRYGVKGCTVQYKSARFFGLFSNTSERYLVLNISQGGLHFITKDTFQEGIRLLLNINAPLLGEEIIRSRGRIVWVNKSTEINAHRVGIELTGPGNKDRIRLKLLLDNAILEKIDLTTRIYLKEVEKL